MKMENKQTPFFARLSPICFLSLLALQGISVAQATIVASPGGPAVSAGANGSTIVDIKAPGSGGVSHNIYSQFDVDRGGVVLNNSATNSTSQLAGGINGNSNLSNGSAAIILNEVNSSRASQLNGMIEVAGKNAQVIIANPSGITCNGCGFINANRATLTTGKALVVAGELVDYSVTKGKITINGDGLLSSSANYTDLISLAVSINANVQAKDLKITAGQGRVNADNTQIDMLPSASPYGAGIDVSKLGGMYADKITLVGTQKGVGVNNAGTIAASVSDVAMNIDGSLINKGSISAKNNLTVASRSTTGTIDNSAGSMEAGNDITLQNGYINNTKGTMAATGNVSIASTANVGQQGIRVGVENNSGILSAKKGVTINAKGSSINNKNGIISAVDDVTMTAKYHVDNVAGRISSSVGGIDIKSEASYNINNTNGLIESNCCTTLQAYNINNTSGTIQSKDDIVINAAYELNNNLGTIQSGANVAIDNKYTKNVQGKIMAEEALKINAATLTNSATSNSSKEYGLFSKGNMTLTTTGDLLNSNGHIKSNGDIAINPQNSFTNVSGSIESNGNITIDTKKSIDNNSGIIIANKNIVINAASIYTGYLSSKSHIQANNELEINVKKGALTNGMVTNGGLTNSGTLIGKNKLTVNAEGDIVNGGKMLSDKVVELNGNRFTNNRNAVVTGPESVSLRLKNKNYTNSGEINGPVTVY